MHPPGRYPGGSFLPPIPQLTKLHCLTAQFSLLVRPLAPCAPRFPIGPEDVPPSGFPQPPSGPSQCPSHSGPPCLELPVSLPGIRLWSCCCRTNTYFPQPHPVLHPMLAFSALCNILLFKHQPQLLLACSVTLTFPTPLLSGPQSLNLDDISSCGLVITCFKMQHRIF